MAIQPFLEYNPNTGLIVKTKSEILQSLISIAKSAYGESYVVDEGTEMYTFLDILASGLADMGNAALDVYNAFSFIYATGAPLDSLCSLAGVVREVGETDTQLRAKYYRFLYSKSVGTVEGLEAKLLEYTNSNGKRIIKDVKVYENYNASATTEDEGYEIATSSEGVYIVNPYSILVILRFNEEELESTDLTNADITNINDIILNYKSLGCGVTINNVDDNELITVSPKRYFATTNTAELTLNINLWFSTNADKTNYGSAVKLNLETAIRKYLSELKMGENIQYSAIMSCIYNAYTQLSVKDFIFSLGSTNNFSDATNAITYEGTFMGNAINTKEEGTLSADKPTIKIPYTTYIDPETTIINITINSESST